MAIKAAKPTDETPFQKFFNMKRVADVTGIHPDKIYNNFKGSYASIDDDNRAQIAKVMIPQVKQLFEFLGYKVDFKKEKQ